jgi:hypothetical protein
MNAQFSNGGAAMSFRACRGCSVTTAMLVAAALSGGARAGAQVPIFTGDEVHVTAGELGVEIPQQVAVFPDGGFVVAWCAVEQLTTGRAIALHARVFAADDMPVTDELRLLSPGPEAGSRQAPDALLVDAAGNLLVVYEEAQYGQPSGIFAQRLTSLGSPFGPRIQVSETNPLPRSRALAALTPDGGFVVAWGAQIQVTSDSLTYDTYVRRFDADGAPLGGEVRTVAGDLFNPVVPAGVGVAPDGSFVVGYQQRNPSTQRFAADGTAGPVRAVQYHGDFSAGFAQLVMAPDGGYVMAWTNYGVDSREPPRSYTGPLPYPGNYAGVGARMFGPSGAPRRGEFEVNRYGPGEQVLGGLAPLPGGGFIAVWNDFSGRDGEGFDVYGRAFSGRRQPLSGDLRLSQQTAGTQLAPVVASNAAGDVIAVWLQQGGSAAPLQDLIARHLRTAPPPP